MSTEERLGASLAAGLHAEVADIMAPAGLAATIRRRHTRRMWLTRSVALTPAVAAVTVVALLASGAGRGERGGAADGTPSTTASVRTVAEVTSRASTALASLDDYVMETRFSPTTDVRDVSLCDHATHRERFDSFKSDGAPLYSILVTADRTGAESAVVVSHTEHAWWRWSAPPPPATPDGARRFGNYQDPKSIQGALDSGDLELLGDERINGHDAVKLRRIDEAGDQSAGAFRGELLLWVDSGTYLPVRTISSGKAGAAASTTDFAWLPRTAESLARVDLAPPAGYRFSDRPIEPAAPGPGVG